jgi:uncharacterized DUF497 family protein
MLLHSKGVEEQEFDWDESNIRHLARHDVSPLEAEQAILDPDAVVFELQTEEEDRFKTMGRAAGGPILVTVFAFRGEAIRPITAYDATIRDQRVYLKTGPLL